MRYLLITFAFVLPFVSLAQTETQGEVSYVSSSSVYVRFENTAGIEVGDTLQMAGSSEACLLVLNKSSVSLVTEIIGECSPEVGQVIQAKVRKPEPETPVDPVQVESPDPPTEIAEVAPISEEGKDDLRIRGNSSIASYNVFSGNGFYSGYSRNVARLNMDIQNVGTPGLDIDFNGNYQYFHYLNRESTTPEAEGRLNLYNAALRWNKDLNSTGSRNLNMELGRFSNRRAASLGPIDGLLAELHLNNFFVGGIVGSRPDFETFGVNPQLLQFGGYVGADFSANSSQHQSTIGWLQQGNSGGIDRRYLYLQHSSSFGGKLTLFASSEMDLYENFDTATARQTFKLSSLYLSANYRFHPKWNLFLSYDSRQQIIFFQQYDSEIERLLDESGIQQGYRARLRYNPNRHWSFALGYHHRLRTGSSGNGSNAQLYMGYRDLPWMGGSISLQANLNMSRYLQSEVGSIRYSRMLGESLRFQVYSRYLQYHYIGREFAISPQWYYGTEWSYRLGGGWSLGILAEYSMQKDQDVIRGNLRLIKRF